MRRTTCRCNRDYDVHCERVGLFNTLWRNWNYSLGFVYLVPVVMLGEFTWITPSHYLLVTRCPREQKQIIIYFVWYITNWFKIQGWETSSFQLISLFLTIFLCQNFSLFFYFQPIFGIFTQVHTVFVFGHWPLTPLKIWYRNTFIQLTCQWVIK